jgi:predicted ATPase
MHIRRVHVRAYKRFTELTIELPEPSRLVMLCGPNGSGKSSLLEALKLWQDLAGDLNWNSDVEYHFKGGVHGEINWLSRSEIEFYEGELKREDVPKAMYFRTAYRNEPEFALGQIARMGDILAGPRPARMIDNDVRVSDNYQRLVGQSVDALFSEADNQLRVVELRERLVGRLGQAVTKVLPELKLRGLADPLSGGTFRFDKGTTQDFPYKNLSGGEKAVFDLLLDMVVKSAAFDQAVVWIDEPEAHTNPLVQSRLVDALLELAAGESQLWLATHSVAMLRRARELSDETPGSVAFLDFGERNFDEPQQLSPVSLSRRFWQRTIATSLGDVAELVAPATLVLCEGQPSKGDRAEFDARCLRAVFEDHEPDAEFVAIGNDRQVVADQIGLGRTVQAVIPGTTVIRLVDRDERSPAEVEGLGADGVTVLGRRNLEGYLLDEEVLKAFCETVGQSENWPDIQQAREQALKSAVDGGKPRDDWKAAKGDIYNACKRILQVSQMGSSADIFLAEQLAPLIKPGVPVYDELRRDVFG